MPELNGTNKSQSKKAPRKNEYMATPELFVFIVLTVFWGLLALYTK